MRAISRKLLVHSCILKKQTGLDRNRNPTYSQTVLKYVRIGATFQTVQGSIGKTKADTMTLFIDAKNTSCETTAGNQTALVLPEENDAVEWHGQNFIVISVTPCCTQEDRMHHWEITLK